MDPVAPTNWRLVALTAGVSALIIGAFFAALHFADARHLRRL